MTDNRFKAMYDLSARLGGSDEEPKMTLRDKFAMAALATEWCKIIDEDSVSDTASDAYQLADAMLEARKTPEGGE
jgi:hypothetical protein